MLVVLPAKISHWLCLVALTLTALSVVSPRVLSAADYFVDNVAGDDRNSGKAPARSGTGSAPFKTIARALRAVDGGDRVILAKNEVPYRESITLEGKNCSGNVAGTFQLIGNGAILDGSVKVSIEVWEHYDGNVFKFRPRRSTNQILYQNDVPLKRNRTRNPAVLEPLQWDLVDGEIYFCVEERKLPQDYPLSICGHRTGITLYQVHDVVISDITVQGFQLDGVNAHDLVRNAEIHSSILRGNGRSGLSVGGASRFKIESCLLGNNGVAQMRVEGFCRVESDDCELIEDDIAVRIDHEGGNLLVAGKPVDRDLK